jgi:glycosyltransferase involved in cell wall biosynthesis
MKKILFVTHDVSLSGAPKSLLIIWENLKQKGYKIDTLTLKGGGGLEERFKVLSSNYFDLNNYSTDIDYSLKKRVLKKINGTKFSSPRIDFYENLKQNNYDFIYSNTVVTLPVAIEINILLGCKLILHVHELDTVLEEFCPNLKEFDNLIFKYIVPSDLNKQCLIEKFKIPSQKIEMIREASELKESAKTDVSSSLKLLMCGGAYWRKGDDLFIQLASILLKKVNNIEFYWVGNSSIERQRVNNSDLIKLGIQNKVSFISETNDPDFWMKQADIFILTSREDPFPLAAIEAGMAGLPIFCFDKATGISEVIDPELVIPYLDLEEFSNRIISFIKNPEKIKFFGEKNKEIFRNYSAEKIAIQIENCLN